MDRATVVAALILTVGLSSAARAQDLSLMVRLRAELEVRDPEAPSARLEPLPLIEERLHAVIEGQHALTELRQVFRNQTGSRLEVATSCGPRSTRAWRASPTTSARSASRARSSSAARPARFTAR